RLHAGAAVFQRLCLRVELERTDLGCSLGCCHAHLSVVGSTLSWRPSHHGDATNDQGRHSQSPRRESMPFTTSVQIRLTRAAPPSPAAAFPQASRLPVWPLDGPSAWVSAPSARLLRREGLRPRSRPT